jgi:hypothetical protein
MTRFNASSCGFKPCYADICVIVKGEFRRACRVRRGILGCGDDKAVIHGMPFYA